MPLASDTSATSKDILNSVNAKNHDTEISATVSVSLLPEPKVTITSLAPDIAIATLETPASEAQNTIETPSITITPPNNEENTEVISKESTPETIDQQNPTPRHAADSDITYTKTTDISNKDNSDNANSSLEIHSSDIAFRKGATEEQADTSLSTINDTQNIAGNKNMVGDKENEGELTEVETLAKEQEEVEKKKETRLEYYKQFIAEQFSHKKIDYPEVRITIEANALPSKMYFVMNLLSAIIASYGLIANSAAVVIGAMLVAMMLGPITGVALAIIDYRMPLLRKSLFTIAAGGFLVIFVGFVVGWLHQGQPLTNEVLSRTQPTSMDLMIALAGGTAGAYAMVSPHLSVAVVGVAVATALVPPLAASGVLFANGEMQLGLGAALLAVTNIIAIQFTNSMVLWFLGFRRLVDDDYKSNTYWTFLKRNAVTLLLLIVLGVYLSINLNTNARQQAFENNVKETINSYFVDKGNVLTNTQFDKIEGKHMVRAVVQGETAPNAYDVQQIEATITRDMANKFPNYLPIKIQLRYLAVQVIESNPLTQDKLNKTDAAILAND